MTVIDCPNCNRAMEVTYNKDNALCWICASCGYEEIRGNEEEYLDYQLNEERN
jgi:DNA-directed RNA polymerase subunit M/transcription elongation factor TFIIS